MNFSPNRLKNYLLDYSEGTPSLSLEYKNSEKENLLTSERVRERILVVLSYKKSVMMASCV